MYGNDWATIGQALGRSASSVKDKCRLMKETCNSGNGSSIDVKTGNVQHKLHILSCSDILSYVNSLINEMWCRFRFPSYTHLIMILLLCYNNFSEKC